MEKDNKSLLQEYCHKNHISLPLYKSYITGGTHHQPVWSASVVVGTNNYKPQGQFFTRKESEKKAAQLAYTLLLPQFEETDMTKSNSQLRNTYKNPLPPPLLLIPKLDVSIDIDTYVTEDNPVTVVTPNSKLDKTQYIDSIPYFNDLSTNTIYVIDLENIQPNFPSNIGVLNLCIHFFLSSFSTVDADKYKDIGVIHIIDSSSSEAADHFMTYKVAQLSLNVSKTANFVIVSRDKSSSILTHMLKVDGFNVTHIKSAKELSSYLLTQSV
jgi:hypothetical protein